MSQFVVWQVVRQSILSLHIISENCSTEISFKKIFNSLIPRSHILIWRARSNIQKNTWFTFFVTAKYTINMYMHAVPVLRSQWKWYNEFVNFNVCCFAVNRKKRWWLYFIRLSEDWRSHKSWDFLCPDPKETFPRFSVRPWHFLRLYKQGPYRQNFEPQGHVGPYLAPTW